MALADASGVFHVEDMYLGPASMLGSLMPAIAVRLVATASYPAMRSIDFLRPGSVPHVGGATINHSKFTDILHFY